MIDLRFDARFAARSISVFVIALSVSVSALAVEFSAGAARVEMVPVLPVPLAGYSARFPHRAGSVHDATAATAVVLQADETTIAMVSVDLCGISGELRSAVCEKLRDAKLSISPDHLLIAATHTHTGPGGYVDHPLWIQAVGPYEKRIFGHLADRIAHAIVVAHHQLKPATLGWAGGAVDGFQTNRRGDGVIDPQMTVVRLRNADRRDIAAMVFYTGHPTILGPADLEVSRDWPGAMCDAIGESLDAGAECLFFNGAEGDVAIDRSPPPGVTDASRYARAERVGREIAREAVDLLEKVEPSSSPAINVVTRPCTMPASFNAKLLPPRPTVSQRIELGGLWLLSVPGEATATIGVAMKDAAHRAGAQRAVIVGLANDHLSYLITPQQFKRGGYERLMCFYGSDTAIYLARAALGDVVPDLAEMDSSRFLETFAPSPATRQASDK